MSTYYIGADVHSNHTELAIERRGKIVQRYSVPTTIPAIVNVLDSIQGKKYLAMEEGPMAGWLYRNLNSKLDQFVSSDPRRNKLIVSDGDKDDKIDSAKLASLLRGGFLRPVHHSDDNNRAELKHWVSLYHDRVRDAVRGINKIRARCRMYGITIPRRVLRDSKHRLNWLSKIKHPVLARQLEMLWIGYDATVKLFPDKNANCWPVAGWRPVMGKFGYKRVFSYRFLEKGGYVAMAKKYKEYVKETRGLKTLQDKAAQRPIVKTPSFLCQSLRIRPYGLSCSHFTQSRVFV